MPAERLSMRKVREVLRLKYACGASERVIARSVGIGRTAIGEYIRRAAVIGITWPVPEELDDAALERKLSAPAGYNPPQSKPLPEWGYIHAELRRRGVTDQQEGDPMLINRTQEPLVALGLVTGPLFRSGGSFVGQVSRGPRWWRSALVVGPP